MAIVLCLILLICVNLSPSGVEKSPIEMPCSTALSVIPVAQYRITRDRKRWHSADFGAPNNLAGGEISSIFPAATKAT